MSLRLFSLSMLINSALFTLVQGSPVPQPVGHMSVPQSLCKTTIQSRQGDTCRSIGGAHGMYDFMIQQANTFRDCSDICMLPFLILAAKRILINV
jgi:hypothetical protein